MTTTPQVRFHKRIFYGWYVVAASLVLLFVSAGAGFYSFGIFIKPLNEEFGWSRASISLAMSIYFILGGLTGPLAGKWVDTHDPRKLMTLSAIGLGVCFILLSLTRSLWYFYAIYAVLGLIHAGMGIVPVSTVVARWFTRRRGLALGIAMVGLGLGGLFLAPVVGLMMQVWGWRWAFATMGIAGWALAIPAASLLMRSRPEAMGLHPDGVEQEGSTVVAGPAPATAHPPLGLTAPARGPSNGDLGMAQALRTQTFWWTASAFFLVTLAQVAVMQHQNPYLRDAGITPAMAALALGLTAGIGALGKLLSGRLADWMRPSRVAMICFALQGLGLFILMTTRTPVQLWLHVLVFGLGMGGVIVLLPLLVADVFGMSAFGVLVGAISVAQSAGGSFGPVIAGLMYDLTGSYILVFQIFLVVYAASIASIWTASITTRRRALQPVASIAPGAVDTQRHSL